MLSATDEHPSTGHFTSCNILGKDTTYMVGPPPYLINSPRLGDGDELDLRHVCLKIRSRHRHTALGATHPCLLLLSEGHFLPRRPLLICRLPPLPQYESGCT